MKAALNLKQSQRLVMTPQLQQAIGLLQMNAVELSAALMDAHMTNPLLEMEEADSQHESVPDGPVPAMEFMDESRGSLGEDWVDWSTRPSPSLFPQANGLSETLTQPHQNESLYDTLGDQLNLLPLNPLQRVLTDYLVLHLNEAGYLEVDLETLLVEMQDTLASDTKITLSDLESALGTVQSLDPIGVGARTPEECLLLQLSAQPSGGSALEAAKTLVQSYLPLLANRDFPALRRKLGVGQDILCEAVKLIRDLNPHPGYSVGRVSVNYILPDILVERQNRVWTARLNMAALPKLLINPNYRLLVKENHRNDSFSRLKVQLQDAQWLLANLKKRHETVRSVASEIVVHQQSFFDHGPAMMKPMRMREIAEGLDIHESTVSRAVNGKYMLTPMGTFELRYFFSTGVGAGNGHLSSSVAVRALIQEMVAAESPLSPISDMTIHERLRSLGFDIARRTVAKYREQMNILPSSRRKSLLEAAKG